MRNHSQYREYVLVPADALKLIFTKHGWLVNNTMNTLPKDHPILAIAARGVSFMMKQNSEFRGVRGDEKYEILNTACY